MVQPDQPRYSNQSEHRDKTFKQQVHKLHQLTVYGRWLFVGILWLTIGLLSLWGLREEIALWQQYFTWVAVRYGLYYNPIPTLGLAICIGMTLGVLVWQSRNILWGISSQEKRRLEQQVQRIRQQGPSHPLWKWVCQ
ncbi:hypothetical protein [Gloeocapsopsis dulcis]|uniref:Uncharacterized protein n=1 Tax=Gloeocapsopsis dulcis AAB1 = 1H9 TaxID=1433147 RepID=A0A6N8FX12_9CHRO|nr:hypothetical protein [Gloeocapsopsis dulcis]MUL37162.1 hypothetical protein [Gloeocapsopsis dulcis AAB1 = 1H9]WNN90232.1 hypothetical protein P0S91_03785 [Gloeocapsopsis dulcis]